MVCSCLTLTGLINLDDYCCFWDARKRWRYLDAIYFCVVTLTTSGLGDFVPATTAGVRFHYFYCVIGLGLIALLLTAIYDFVTAIQEEAKNVLLLNRDGTDAETKPTKASNNSNGKQPAP